MGRILLTKEYIPKFGEKYVKRFERKLDGIEGRSLRTGNASIKAAYGNLLTWRNGFAHEGQIPGNATYAEVKRAYAAGKEVMRCLAETMRR